MRSTSHLWAQALLTAAATAQRTQSIWGQCGGSGYTGPTACPQTAYCNFGNPWYSQCIPASADAPLPGVPDSPIITQTIQTIVTVAPPSIPDPVIVTTFITFLTPSATATPAGPGYTVIDGTTFTILPRSPVTAFLDSRSLDGPGYVLIPVEPRDVDRAPVFDTAIEPLEEAAAALEARSPSPAPEPDVDRPPVYDTPIARAGDAVAEEEGEATEVEKRDVDRPPVYDTPLTDVEKRSADEKRDVDRPPVYDTAIDPDSPIDKPPQKAHPKRDVDRAPVYDTPISADSSVTKPPRRRDVDRAPVYDTPLDDPDSSVTKPPRRRSSKRDVDRAPVYDTAIDQDASITKPPQTPRRPKRDVDRELPAYDVPLEIPLDTADAANAPTPTVLAKGQYWIRAVASPNFHKYLQTKVANTADVAILGSSRTAGQFSIQGGQLVEATGGEPLYMHVEKPSDFTQRTLATWFNATKNEFGTFAFQGDTLSWTAPEVKRQNAAAWLVCRDQALFINTGAYAYQTPSGCADQTIHYYNDAKAND